MLDRPSPDNASGIISRNNPLLISSVHIRNKGLIFMAGTVGVIAEGIFCAVEGLIVWKDKNKVVCVVLHRSAFLDTAALKCLSSR